MRILAALADERVKGVSFDDNKLHVDLMDGRHSSAPLRWLPRLAAGTPAADVGTTPANQ